MEMQHLQLCLQETERAAVMEYSQALVIDSPSTSPFYQLSFSNFFSIVHISLVLLTLFHSLTDALAPPPPLLLLPNHLFFSPPHSFLPYTCADRLLPASVNPLQSTFSPSPP